MPASSPVTIVAIATAAQGHENALRDAQSRLVAETANEPGCIRYELHQSLDDGRVLIFVETWANEGAWRAHMQGPAIGRFRASRAATLIQDFVLHRLAVVADGRLGTSSEGSRIRMEQ